MIDLSESYVKRRYSAQFWIRSAMYRVSSKTKLLIITDLGFKEELNFLLQTFGPDHVLTVAVNRDGANWSTDSRQPLAGPNHLVVDNCDSPSRVVIPIRKLANTLWSLAHS